jgi:hypothetical protein
MENLTIVLYKGRLDRDQGNRLAKLLDMLYTPNEIASEIGFSRRQFYRVYIPAGCPCTRDSVGHLWVNGKEFQRWIKETYKKQEVKQNEAFCLTCKKAVPMVKPEKVQKDRLQYYLCVCPNCGRKLARIITRGKRIDD